VQYRKWRAIIVMANSMNGMGRVAIMTNGSLFAGIEGFEKAGTICRHKSIINKNYGVLE